MLPASIILLKLIDDLSVIADEMLTVEILPLVLLNFQPSEPP